MGVGEGGTEKKGICYSTYSFLMPFLSVEIFLPFFIYLYLIVYFFHLVIAVRRDFHSDSLLLLGGGGFFLV